MPKGFGNFGAIYRIRNRVNGKFYIGSTINFKARFYQHSSRVKRKVNSHLTNAVNKYGRENFSYELLERVNDFDILENQEQFYIDKFIKPLPFQSHYNYRIEDISRNSGVELPSKRKKFKVRGPCGQIYTGHGVQIFCEEHVGNDGTPILDSDFNAMLRGKTKHCKGWHLPETNPEDIYKHFGRRKSFILESPEGELVEFQGITEFEQKYGLSSISDLLNPSKNKYSAKGWIVPGTDRTKLARRHYEEFTLKEISTDKLHTYDNVTDFCKHFKISQHSNHITDVINGSRTSACGFCLPETEIEKTRKVSGQKFYIKAPDGKIYFGTEYKSFSDTHGLQYKSVSAIFQKDSGKLSHKGWEPSTEEDYLAQQNGAPLIPHQKNITRHWLGKTRSAETIDKIISTKLKKLGLQGYLLANNAGEIFFTKDRKEFCEDFNISYPCVVRALTAGKDIRDGWKRLLRGKNQWFTKHLKIKEKAPDCNFLLDTQLLEEISKTDQLAKKQIHEGFFGWLINDGEKEFLEFNLTNFCKEKKMYANLLIAKSAKGRIYKGHSVSKNLNIPKDVRKEVLKYFENRPLYFFK